MTVKRSDLTLYGIRRAGRYINPSCLEQWVDKRRERCNYRDSRLSAQALHRFWYWTTAYHTERDK